MIDWMTLKYPADQLPEEIRDVFRSKVGQIIAVDPDGEILWSAPKRETIRSDSHQVSIELGGDLRIFGSPARVKTDRIDNVFGSGDPVECATRMIEFVNEQFGVQLPPVFAWQCTRIDQTLNYNLGDLPNVKKALKHLRKAEGGRYQVRTMAESVYWSVRSTYRSAKAYAKGEHMRYLAKRGRAHLDAKDQELCDGLLRLELTLKRHFFSKLCDKPWHKLTQDDLEAEHDKYFSNLIGSVEVDDMKSIEQGCIDAAARLGLSEGRGRSAYLSWCVIESVGIDNWRDRVARATYFTHKRILLEAGLSWSDLSAGVVVPLRRHKLVLGNPVRSWTELRAVA